MGWFDLVLLILASFRLTHLIVFDDIAEPVRKLLDRWRFTAVMIACYWCAGIWASAGLVLLYLLWPTPARVLLLVLAVAGGQALVERVVQRPPG